MVAPGAGKVVPGPGPDGVPGVVWDVTLPPPDELVVAGVPAGAVVVVTSSPAGGGDLAGSPGDVVPPVLPAVAVVAVPAGPPVAGPEVDVAPAEDDVVSPLLSPEFAPDLSPDELQAAARTMNRIRADFVTVAPG